MRCLVTGSEKAACVEEPGGMRQPCVDDDDCYINGSLCYKGRCMCTPGLSYHKAGQACVRRCRVYGKIMSVYEELSITEHNDFVSQLTPNAKCIHKCTAEKSFLCLSVDMSSNGTTCLLSSSGYLDVSKSDRQSGDVGWLFGTRDCEYP
ncbi:uncharacterized protein LOC125376777 [Haliotis rufescens]|uniref:uncharacterized protein LOC125376777 n=1 Tax=Haliotis rufescens TaxID=6454 RepID=UPI00201F7072|nr:uncharacterized protein LOC125376777 [Haliotis rufescens]